MADPTDEYDLFITIDGKVHGFNVEDLELWEVETIEEVAGLPIDEVDFNRAAPLRALAFIALRRKNPQFTMDEARHIKLGRFKAVESEPNGDGPAKRPTKAAKPAAKSA